MDINTKKFIDTFKNNQICSWWPKYSFLFFIAARNNCFFMTDRYDGKFTHRDRKFVRCLDKLNVIVAAAHSFNWNRIRFWGFHLKAARPFPALSLSSFVRGHFFRILSFSFIRSRFIRISNKNDITFLLLYLLLCKPLFIILNNINKASI